MNFIPVKVSTLYNFTYMTIYSLLEAILFDTLFIESDKVLQRFGNFKNHPVHRVILK
jgi:hypothetical protein